MRRLLPYRQHEDEKIAESAVGLQFVTEKKHNGLFFATTARGWHGMFCDDNIVSVNTEIVARLAY